MRNNILQAVEAEKKKDTGSLKSILKVKFKLNSDI